MNASTAKTEAADNGQENARGWYSTICEMVAALECDYDRLQELRDERAALAVDAESAAPDNEDERAAIDKWDTDNGEELRALRDACTIDGEEMDDDEAVRERIQESPLEVSVRSDWYSPGIDADDDARKPAEFQILLSTGGPALRLMGDLDEHGQPTRAYLQHQGWGTPWTDIYMGEGSGAVLLTFAQVFYFGE